MGGDFRFFWTENIKYFARFPSSWDSSLNTGIGIPSINTLWISSYFNLTSSLSHFGISWNVISLFTWIIPFLLLSFISSFFLFRSINNRKTNFDFLAGLIYTINSYFLLIFSGGQIGVCFAYSLIPLIVLSFIRLLKNLNLYSSILFALVFSLELLFDPRFAFLTLIIVGIYYLLRFKFSLKELFYVAIIPGIMIVLLHSFWLIPLLLFKTNIIPQGFDSEVSVRFFSFANFENSISLLHPNWPDNIFGKIYFMRPEFLVLPIIAYSSLFFVNKDKSRFSILFFAFIGIIGSFLAKGTNEPFGDIFLFMFNHVPGFSLFRDPTKFYVLVALAYSMLIPFSLLNISEQVSNSKKFSIKSKFLNKKYTPSIIIVSFILFWLFCSRLLFTTDIFRVRQVPKSYVQFKDFVISQNQFFRTLWIPQWQRYAYFSDQNPAIGRGEMFKEASASGMIKELKQKGKLETLRDLSVKYIIIPEDSEGEIFLNDRKYDDLVYTKTISAINEIEGLKEVKNFGKIAVFEIDNPKDHFWSTSKNVAISYRYILPTKYLVYVKNVKKGDLLVFAENYNPYWEATVDNVHKTVSFNYRGLNSFVLSRDGDYSLEINYQPQKMVDIGLIISGVTLLAILFYLIKFRDF